jgi:uncharacterized membrane protein SirB2
MLLASALYVYDALILLASNEALLVRQGRGWRAVFGSHRWRLAGKEPCAPGLLAPHRPIVRLAWQFAGQPAAAWPRQQMPLPVGLGGLALCAWLSGLTLFVLLPLSLFGQLGTWITLGVIGLLYAVNLSALVLLYRIHRRLQVPAGKYWSVAFECLVCPPFCINLVRRACEWQGLKDDFLQASGALLTPPALAEVHTQCLLRIDEQIAFEDEQSSRMAALQRARERFLPQGARP